jgi:hypothetical protein
VHGFGRFYCSQHNSAWHADTSMVVHVVHVIVVAVIMCASVEVHVHVATPTQPRSTINRNASLVLVITYGKYACYIIVLFMNILSN